MGRVSKNLIKADHAHIADPVATAPARVPASAPGAKTGAAGAKEGGPKIVLHRNGTLIEAIEVTCRCGHTMIIECEYEEERES